MNNLLRLYIAFISLVVKRAIIDVEGDSFSGEVMSLHHMIPNSGGFCRLFELSPGFLG
jgi:hypothetical protein